MSKHISREIYKQISDGRQKWIRKFLLAIFITNFNASKKNIFRKSPVKIFHSSLKNLISFLFFCTQHRWTQKSESSNFSIQMPSSEMSERVSKVNFAVCIIPLPLHIIWSLTLKKGKEWSEKAASKKNCIKKESRSAKRKPKREKLYENCKIIDNDLLSLFI